MTDESGRNTVCSDEVKEALAAADLLAFEANLVALGFGSVTAFPSEPAEPLPEERVPLSWYEEVEQAAGISHGDRGRFRSMANGLMFRSYLAQTRERARRWDPRLAAVLESRGLEQHWTRFEAAGLSYDVIKSASRLMVQRELDAYRYSSMASSVWAKIRADNQTYDPKRRRSARRRST